MFNSFINWRAGEFFGSPVFDENTVLSEGGSIPLVSKNCLISWNSDSIEFSIKGKKLIELNFSVVTIEMIISLMNELEKMSVNDFKEKYLKMNVKVFKAEAIYRTWAKTGYLFDNGWYFCEYLYYNRPTLFFANECNGLSGKNQFERVDKDPEFPNFEGYQPFKYTGKDKDTKRDFVEYVKELIEKGLFDVNSDKFKELEIDLNKEIQITKSDTPHIIENNLSPSPFSYLTIENFKNIDEKQDFNLKPITVVTGKNNSGKSSMLKSLMLLKNITIDDDTKQIVIDNYDEYDLPIYNLDFKNIKSRNYDGQYFSIGINLENKLKKRSDEKLVLTLYFEIDELNLRLILRELEVCTKDSETVIHIVQNKSIEINKEFFNVPNNINWIQEENEEVVNKLLEQAFMFIFNADKAGISFVDFIQANSLITKQEKAFKDELKEFFNAIEELLKKDFKSIQYIPSIRGSLERTFGNTSFIGKALKSYYPVSKDDDQSKIKKEIDSWFKEFKMGSKANVEKTRGRFELSFNGMNIADMGFGYNQLVPVIISSLLAYKNGIETIVIEEPESNLHPDLQSKLADFFVFVNNKYGTQFIIETHSVAFIRSLQLKIKNKLIKKEDVNIIFFQTGIDTESYEMVISENGLFKNKFEEGFVGEIDRQINELLK